MPDKEPPTTLVKKLGFADSDLTTPKHDEIMLWLDNWLNSDVDVLGIHFSHTPEYGTAINPQKKVNFISALEMADIIEFGIKEGNLSKKAREDFLNADTKLTPTRDLIWEFAIPNQGKGAYGFIDLMMVSTLHYKRDLILSENSSYNQSRGGLKWALEADDQIEYSKVAFEVKSAIPSLGAIIREIRYYQSTLPWCGHPLRYGQRACMCPVNDTHFYVVCPDDRWVEPLTKQSIGFVHYPTGSHT